MRKIMDYLKSGVDLVWLIDPEGRTVNVYPRDRAPYLLGEAEELTGENVLPEFRCKVGVWSRRHPQALQRRESRQIGPQKWGPFFTPSKVYAFAAA